MFALRLLNGNTKSNTSTFDSYIHLCRCFLSAGFPASSPAKSRVVEALYLLLCEKFPQSSREVHAGKPFTISRWKLIISEYNSVRARLLNSQALLEGTNLMLYTINQTTLVRWHKNSSRRDEIRLLMQGLSPPRPQFTTDPNSSPPAKSLQSGPGPSPLNPCSFPEAEDTTGQAQIQKR